MAIENGPVEIVDLPTNSMVIFYSKLLVYQRVSSIHKDGMFHVQYPLVNVYITMERSTMLLMGKSTISMAIFNSKLSNYERVYINHHQPSFNHH